MKSILKTGLLSLLIALPGAAQNPWRIQSVNITGNHAFTTRRLVRLMISHPPSLFSRPRFDARVFENDLNVLQRFYHQEGYLEAGISRTESYFDSVRHHVRLEIEINEGALTTVEGISILGNRAFPDSLLRGMIPLKQNAAMQARTIDKGTLAILTHYADAGYLDARIRPEPRINMETHRALIDYAIEEGYPQTIDSIHVTGNSKTRLKTIQQELMFKPGERISYKKLLISQRNLYLAGIFESVFIQPSATADSMKRDISIQLKEKPSIELNAAVGYGAVDHLRARIEVSNQNLAGRGLKLGLALKASAVFRGADAGFTIPRLEGSPWRLDIKARLRQAEEPGYTLTEPAAQLSLSRKITNRLQFQSVARSAWGRLTQIKTAVLPADSLSRVNTLKYSLSFDSRNNLFDPDHGNYLELTHELGSTFGRGLGDFQRVIFQGKAFITWRNWVMATALECGWMQATGGLSAIPLQERFYTGGPTSLRGFAYQRVGPLDQKRTPTGGRIKIIWNLIEIRRPIWKMVGLALFCDLGNVWETPADMVNVPVRLSPGAGIRIHTPIGVARIDCGWNIDPRPDEKEFRWMFNMGQSF